MRCFVCHSCFVFLFIVIQYQNDNEEKCSQLSEIFICDTNMVMILIYQKPHKRISTRYLPFCGIWILSAPHLVHLIFFRRILGYMRDGNVGLAT